MTSTRRALAQVHLAVFLFGLAGLFGKFLAIPSLAIVLGRTAFASLVLVTVLGVRRQSLRLVNQGDYAIFLVLGVGLAFHWYAFFRAIQLSTVAVGLLTFSSFPLFVTVLEPWVLQTRWRWEQGMGAIAVFIGVALVVPDYAGGAQVAQGALWGLLSGFSFAILQLANRRYVQRYSPLVVSFYQTGLACLTLIPIAWHTVPTLTSSQWLLLAILGSLCTALAHTLFITSLQAITAQAASLISTLEPVYGIFLAFILLAEVPNGQTLVGGLLILGATTWITWRVSKTT